MVLQKQAAASLCRACWEVTFWISLMDQLFKHFSSSLLLKNNCGLNVELNKTLWVLFDCNNSWIWDNQWLEEGEIKSTRKSYTFTEKETQTWASYILDIMVIIIFTTKVWSPEQLIMGDLPVHCETLRLTGAWTHSPPLLPPPPLPLSPLVSFYCMETGQSEHSYYTEIIYKKV